jgi:alpha-galactosidase
LSKSIKIETSSHYTYKGKLDFKVTDPENNAVIYQKTNDADFSAGRPFTYTFSIAGSWSRNHTLITYTFTDENRVKINKNRRYALYTNPLCERQT